MKDDWTNIRMYMEITAQYRWTCGLQARRERATIHKATLQHASSGPQTQQSVAQRSAADTICVLCVGQSFTGATRACRRSTQRAEQSTASYNRRTPSTLKHQYEAVSVGRRAVPGARKQKLCYQTLKSYNQPTRKKHINPQPSSTIHAHMLKQLSTAFPSPSP